jgi:hypothetical protein
MMMQNLTQAAINDFKASVQGELLCADDPASFAFCGSGGICADSRVLDGG